MVKLKGPGLSLEASGTAGKILTFGKTKGRAILRKKPVPRQPRSGLQVSMRAMMQFLSQQWKNLTAGEQATWASTDFQISLSMYNAFIKHNLERWRSRKPPSKEYPAAEVNTPSDMPGITARGGTRHVELEMWNGSGIPGNWTLMVFHKFEAPAASDVDQLVHVQLAEAFGMYPWTHTPLKPGTHHYNLTGTSTDGKVDWGVFSSDSTVVT